jgi:glutaredoxin domain-containing cysteine-rich protein 1
MTAVRKRCEECRQVKRIFANMRIRVEERDVFMNAKYQTELDDRIGRIATVPQVFISGQLVGGAAKIEELNETGELQKMLADFERLEWDEQCELCGGHRFIACLQCSGSKKGVRNAFTVLRCTACNEAGLMKCPECNTPAS